VSLFGQNVSFGPAVAVVTKGVCGRTAVVILLEYIPNRYLLTQAICRTHQFSREQTAGRSSDHGFDEAQPFFVELRGELF